MFILFSWADLLNSNVYYDSGNADSNLGVPRKLLSYVCMVWPTHILLSMESRRHYGFILFGLLKCSL